MKGFLFGITALSLSLGMPVATQASEKNITVTTAQFEQALEHVTDTYTKYATSKGVNIRKEPNIHCEIFDQTLLNTSFEVVAEIDGWSMITTEDGYAYIASQYLSDTPVSNRWNLTLTAYEKDLLARITMLECGNQCDEGQQAVVEVILNRIISNSFPDTLYDVLSQKRQFSTWKNRDCDAATPTDRVVENINKVLNGETDILPMKTVFFSRKGENSRIQTVIEDHVFCNE